MRVSCAWCGRAIVEQLGRARSEAVSHGICRRCLAIETNRRPPWWLGLGVALAIAGAFTGALLFYRALLVLARL